MKEAIKKNRILLIFTIIFSILFSLIMVSLSLLMQSLIDKVTIRDMEGFKMILFYTVAYCIIIATLYFIYSIFSKLFIKNITEFIRNKIFNGLFRYNYKDFISKNTGEYISILTNDIKLVEDNYIIPLLLTLQYLVTFITTIIILLWLSPLVTLCLFITMFIMFLVPNIFNKILQEKQLSLSNQLTSFTKKIKDIFLGYDIIKSYNLKEPMKKEFGEENNILVRKKFEADRLFVLNETISQFLGITTQFIAIALAAYLVIIGKLSMGMLIAIVQLSGTFVQPVIMIIGNVPKIRSMKEVLNRIDSFINYENENLNGEKIPEFTEKIEVKGLTFSYDNKKNILKDLNLILEKNKKYAIVGTSGSGKSTLIKLLIGYYGDYEGKISFDGVNIKEVNIEELNRMISVIHQNIYMFDKTIKENICLYKEFSEENLNNALRLSGADKFIEKLENGLDSMVGENGNNLSGGQKQRLAIARAILQRSSVLVLDEGTSAIDMQTAYDIESKLLNVKELTLLTITHKLSEELLDKYDEIIFIDDGTIVEKGSFKELLENKSKFFSFYNLETL